MAITVKANGLTITHKGSGGMHACSVPDVCKTPTPGGPVPIPYPIIAMNTDIAQGTTTVKADGGQMIAHKSSVFMKCTGDQPGTVGGVVSGVFGQKSEWITFSPNVYVQGKNISRLTDKLFMNNKNTISGQGGQVEVPIPGGDAVLDALCNIFCEAREEWLDCKHVQKRSNCEKPSIRARNKVNSRLAGNTPLSRAVSQRVPDGFGAAERTLLTPGNRLLDGARKFYDENGLRRAIERKTRSAMASVAASAGARLTRRMWMKLVPGLNILGYALDTYEVITTGAEIINEIRNSSAIFDDAIRVQPDFSLHNADGSIADVYDFKFDDPVDGYVDDWNMDRNQRDIYERSSSNSNATAVKSADGSGDGCNCATKYPPAGRVVS